MIGKVKYYLISIILLSHFSGIHCAEDRYEALLGVVNQHTEQFQTVTQENAELRRQLSEVVNNLTNVVNFTNTLVPVGTIMEYSGTAVVPNNWLECNGQTVSRDDYPDLYSAIGINYGLGNIINTFHLPDRRGRVAVGIDSNNSTNGHITNATAADIALGKTFGEETHTLEIGELASHVHGLGYTSCLNIKEGPSGLLVQTTLEAGTIKPSTHHWNGNTENIDRGNQPHNNMQPSIFLKFYIRAK